MENQQMQNGGQPVPRTGQRKQGMDPMTRIIVIVFIIAIGGAVAYFQPWKSIMGTAAPAADAGAVSALGVGGEPAQGEVAKDALEALGKIMLLPTGDEPVIYAIENAAELIAQQAFFTGAENGDTLFIFPKNQKAIIYSSSRNLVVNAGPLSAQEGAAPVAQEQQVIPEQTEAVPAGQ